MPVRLSQFGHRKVLSDMVLPHFNSLFMYQDFLSKPAFIKRLFVPSSYTAQPPFQFLPHADISVPGETYILRLGDAANAPTPTVFTLVGISTETRLSQS